MGWSDGMEAFLDSLSSSSNHDRAILSSVTKDHLLKLQQQLDDLAYSGEVSDRYLSDSLLHDLWILVRHPTFRSYNMRFDFSVKSLMDLDPEIDSKERYMEVFAILHHLPKEATESRFEGCLLNNCYYFSHKLEPRCNEHKWLLDIGFDLRKRLAYRHIPPQPQINPDTRLHLVIIRDNLLDDSISKIVGAEATSLARGISVTFHNEAGRGPGVLRDWFLSLASAMIDESQDAFLSSGDDIARDGTRFYPKPGAVKDASFYICFGRLLALALIHRIQIGITLDRCLFVQFRDDDLSLDDIRDTSPYLYNSYKDVLKSSETEFPDLNIYGTDSADEDDDDADEDNAVVKFEDREQFISQKIHAQFVEAIQTQTRQILQGFDDVIPSAHRIEFFQIMKLNDLDGMIRGILDLDVEEWRSYTTYEGGFSNLDPQIDWFWQCLSHLSEEGKRNLLFFWTSEKYLPLGGFRALDPPLVLRNGQASSEHLPVASTCMRRLTIPPYPSYKVMFEKLLIVTDCIGCPFELE